MTSEEGITRTADMVRISSLIDDLDALLEPGAFRDYGPNGLQVPGAPEVGRVVTGVSAQVELFERAIELGAQLVLVHHGLFWEFLAPGLSHRQIARLRPLLAHDVNLAAYHLPLDAHPEIGNNALLAQAFGCSATEPFAEVRGRPIGRPKPEPNGEWAEQPRRSASSALLPTASWPSSGRW